MSGTLTLGQAAFMGDLQALRRELAKRKVAAAGGYRNYARDHLNALSAAFLAKFPSLPPEMVRRVVEYAFDVGGHFRGH